MRQAALLLLIVAVVFAFAACGGGDDAGDAGAGDVSYKCSMEKCDKTNTAKTGAPAPQC